MSNSSDLSEALQSDDVEDEEEEQEPEKETVQVIRTWLEDVSGDPDNRNDCSMPVDTHPLGQGGTTLMRMETTNVPMAENTAWYEYPKDNVLPTPDFTDDSGMSMGEYLQLDPALLRGRGTEPSFDLPATCFFDQEPTSPNRQNPSHLAHGMMAENHLFSDGAGCFPPTHTPSLEGSNKVPDCNDWVMGNDASLPGSTSSYPSPTQHNGLPPRPKSAKFRVSITLTCDQAQLALALTQITDFGTGLSISVEKCD